MTVRRAFSYILTLTCALIILIAIPNQIDSPSHFLRQILTPKNGHILQALFSPQDDIRQAIIALINSEQKAIKIAIYFFTDLSIANALIHAKQKKGIDVSVIVDPSHVTKCPHTQIYRLYKAGIPIYIFKTAKEGIFHHKFIYFERNLDDKTFLVTGSFNLTKTAQEYNCENVIITNHTDISEQYRKQFAYLKTNTKNLEQFIKKHRIK